MNNNKSSTFWIGMTFVGIVQLIIRSIHIDNLTVQAYAALITAVCVFTAIVFYANRQKGYGVRFNTISGTLLILNFIVIGIAVIMNKFYNNFFNAYRALITAIVFVFYFGLCLYVIVSKLVRDKKNRHLKDKSFH